LLGPVHVLNQNAHRSLRGQLGKQLDARGLDPVAGHKRMHVTGDVESERETERLMLAEPEADDLSGIALADTEVLPEDISEGPVGHLPVREASARVLEGLGLLPRQ